MTRYNVIIEATTELELDGLEPPLDSTNIPVILATEYLKKHMKSMEFTDIKIVRFDKK